MKLFSAVKEKKLAKAQLRCIEKFAVPGDSDRILDTLHSLSERNRSM